MMIIFFKKSTMIIYICKKFKIKIKTQKIVAIEIRAALNKQIYKENYYDFYLFYIM